MGFSATAVLKANTADFEKGMGDSTASAGALGKGMLVVGAAIIGAVAAMAKFTLAQANAGDQIAKTSKQLGINAQELQRLGFAMKISGGSAASLEKGMKNVNVALEQMSQGKSGEDVGEALRSIGLAADDLAGVGTEDRLGMIADRLKAIQDPARKSALVMQLFGKRAGAELKPLLDAGSKGIDRLGDRFEELGGARSAQMLESAENLVDAQTELNTAFDGVSARLADRFMPAVQAATEAMTKMAPAAEEVANDLADGFDNVGETAGKFGELSDAFGTLTGATGEWNVSLVDVARTYAAVITLGLSEEIIQLIGVALPGAIDIATGAFESLNDTLGRTAIRFDTIAESRAAFDTLALVQNIAPAANQAATEMILANQALVQFTMSAAAAGSIGKSLEKKGGRGGRRRKKAVAAESPEFEADFGEAIGREANVNALNEEIIALERRIELRTIEGEQTFILEEQRLEILEERAVVQEDFDAEQEFIHQGVLLRAQEQQDAAAATALAVEVAKAREKKAQEDAAKAIIGAGEGVIGVHNQLGQTVGMAAEAAGASAEKQEQIERVFMGTSALLIAGVETVKAAASAASFDIPGAVLHAAAAALGFVQGAIILSGGLPGKSTAGGSGGGTARPSQGQQRDTADRPDIPTSPAATDAQQDGQAANGGGGGGGGSTTIFNFQGALIGDPELLTENLNKTTKKGARLAS